MLIPALTLPRAHADRNDINRAEDITFENILRQRKKPGHDACLPRGHTMPCYLW